MATFTTNLNLEKPATSEYYAVSVANSNNDILDGAIGTINSLLVDGVGAKVYIQDIAPSPAVDGDIWFKTSTLTIYFYYAFTDTWVNALAGEKGDTGAYVASAEFVDNDLVFTLSDTSTVTLTDAKLELKGEDGIDGASIVSAEFSGDDILFTKDDATTVTLVDAAIILKGDQGNTGDTGANFTILGTYATLVALQTAHPTGSAGDAWAVGTSDPYLIYIWDTNTLAWTNIGSFTSTVNANSVTFTPYGNISSTNVQNAIQELDGEKQNNLVAGYGDTINPYGSKTAKYFLASPNGSSGSPTFRTILSSDIPTLNQNTTGTSSNVTGTVAIANGGTGQTTKTNAFDALSPLTTIGDIIYYNSTDNVRLAGNTTTTKKFLRQTGTGSVSTAPTWDTVTSTDVGLGNVDNTSDVNKPVSTATQTALNDKAPLSSPTFTGTVALPSTTSIGNVSSTELGYLDGVTSAIQTQINGKQATLVSGTNIKSINGASILGSGNLIVSTNFSATLPYTSWTGSSAPYSKVVSVAGLLSTDYPNFDVVTSGTYATDILRKDEWSKVYGWVTSTDTITFYATEVPSIDIPIIVKVVR